MSSCKCIAIQLNFTFTDALQPKIFKSIKSNFMKMLVVHDASNVEHPVGTFGRFNEEPISGLKKGANSIFNSTFARNDPKNRINSSYCARKQFRFGCRFKNQLNSGGSRQYFLKKMILAGNSNFSRKKNDFVDRKKKIVKSFSPSAQFDP